VKRGTSTVWIDVVKMVSVNRTCLGRLCRIKSTVEIVWKRIWVRSKCRKDISNWLGGSRHKRGSSNPKVRVSEGNDVDRLVPS
jgi:hypothetical protein